MASTAGGMRRFRPSGDPRAGDNTIPSGDDGNEPRAIAAEPRDAEMQPFAAPKGADAWQSNQRDESESESESTPISFTPLRRLQAAIVLGRSVRSNSSGLRYPSAEWVLALL